MRLSIRAIALSLALAPTAALAGPPFLTDDPEPTEAGHWEIYAPLIDGEGLGSNYEGSVAAEFNFGAASDVQVTVGVPIAYTHDAAGMEWGTGDLGISVKYRFYHDEDAGLSIAAFPGLTLPTANNGMGNNKATAFLPVWFQKDSGAWSVFGGGGYAINPGIGNRNYWTGGIALSRQISSKLLIGIEADRQEADAVDGRGRTSFGLGAIYQLKAPFRLLASGGPSFGDEGGAIGFHAFVALGMDY
jgi:Putative MetA-pathway of phenol degradation